MRIADEWVYRKKRKIFYALYFMCNCSVKNVSALDNFRIYSLVVSFFISSLLPFFYLSILKSSDIATCLWITFSIAAITRRTVINLIAVYNRMIIFLCVIPYLYVYIFFISISILENLNRFIEIYIYSSLTLLFLTFI